MKNIFYILGLYHALITGLYAREVTLIKKDFRNGLHYQQYISANIDENSLHFQKYRKIQKIINLQVDYPNSSIIHFASDGLGLNIFAKAYSTNDYGFRKTLINTKATRNLIIAGDSNIFGIGSNDEETISTLLSKNLPQYQLTNMGIAGSAGNSLLYFLQNYDIKSILPNNSLPTVMLYDFSIYLVERMIGSKNFIRWGWMQPAYEINSKDQLVHIGSFNELWITKFYKLINLIDYKNFFFPNLPRTHQHHLQLIARIFLEIKNNFIQHTFPHNRFAILINPFSLNDENRKSMEDLVEEFHKVGIETISFTKEETSPIEIYPKDLHLTPKGQEYYSKMIALKIEPKL